MGADLTTPDDSSGKNFSISSINNDTVEIKTSGGTKIKINRPAFVGVLRYLLENNHILQNPCSVGSNKDISKAGPLCRVARNANGVNIMIINYLLPLLAEMGLVAIDGTNPNSTWVL
jgi:hypothetical protein